MKNRTKLEKRLKEQNLIADVVSKMIEELSDKELQKIINVAGMYEENDILINIKGKKYVACTTCFDKEYNLTFEKLDIYTHLYGTEIIE